MKSLANRYPIPPVSYWQFDIYDREGIPKDPEKLKLWLRSIQKGKKNRADWFFFENDR